MKAFMFSLILVCGIACTNADWAQISTYGSSGEITCYSGGQVIYQGKSTGKIATEDGSDGWFFEEEGTKKLIRVSGDCIIKN